MEAAHMRRRFTDQKASLPPQPFGCSVLTDGGLQGPAGGASLPGKVMDHRRRFGARDRRGPPPATSVVEYMAKRRAFFDPERFRAVPIRRGIRARTPIGQTAAQQNQKVAWAVRCRQSPCRPVLKGRLGLRVR